MLGIALCTAASYDIKPMLAELQPRYRCKQYREALHLCPYGEEDEGAWDLFLFSFGSVVCWGMDEVQVRAILQEVEVHIHEPLPLQQQEVDDFNYDHGSKMGIEEDLVVLPDDTRLSKLSVSYAFAQSAKLAVFEDSIAATFEETKHLPHRLATRGDIGLSRKAIRRSMGHLFIQRSSINLQLEVLDTPEFFWDHPEQEAIYHLVAHEVEIKDRGQVLNERLDVLKELFEMLGDELDTKHSARLEWIIIWLIAIEIVISLLEKAHIL